MHKINQVAKWFKSNKEGKQKGFTLIELLVVVAILGILAAIAVPSVGKFIGSGKTQSYQTELHNVQTAVLAMMTEAYSGQVDNPIAAASPTADLHDIWSYKDSANTTKIYASDYMVGLKTGTTLTATNCKYSVDANGVVGQKAP